MQISYTGSDSSYSSSSGGGGNYRCLHSATSSMAASDLIVSALVLQAMYQYNSANQEQQ
jgi:hypothetical protein